MADESNLGVDKRHVDPVDIKQLLQHQTLRIQLLKAHILCASLKIFSNI